MKWGLGDVSVYLLSPSFFVLPCMHLSEPHVEVNWRGSALPRRLFGVMSRSRHWMLFAPYLAFHFRILILKKVTLTSHALYLKPLHKASLTSFLHCAMRIECAIPRPLENGARQTGGEFTVQIDENWFLVAQILDIR